MIPTEEIKIIDVTAENVADSGIFCIKDKKSPGYHSKVAWFTSKINQGLRIKIVTGEQNKQLGFIEYLPSELAWRPIKADNYLFIQCIALFVKEVRGKGIGSMLIRACEQDAREGKKSGLCAMSSDGPWMANKSLFEKNGFVMAGRRDRFELMIKPFDGEISRPVLLDWTKRLTGYKGWNLIYSDQCPWHDKSVSDLRQAALDNGIKLTIIKLTTPRQAQQAPSGFGTFGLIKDGVLLEDHYISKTRFENILKRETHN
jgi:GNAT superfamily N-acetyltransferase